MLTFSCCESQDLVDVSFDFFDPNPKVDYHAIKRLLSQLFQRDAEQLHTHELTELVLSQPTVGTTIKTDGIESDPYAILTVLNMHLHHVCIFLCLPLSSFQPTETIHS
jgi:protein BCP1